MNIKAKAATYGIVGLVLAGVVIFSGTNLGVLRSSSGGIDLASSGVLSVLLTDPPTVPDGVSAVYISYSDLALHVTGLGDSGWVTATGQGSLETLSLVNLGQTITTGSVPSGRYNVLAFSISSATVKFLGTNYSATVNSGRLQVPIVGGLRIDSSNPAAAMVDIQPTVLNLGTQSKPDFVIATGAKALQIPSGAVVDAMRHVGYRFSLAGRGWFSAFISSHSDNLTISAIALSPGSFSFSASNPGSDSVIIRMVILAPAFSGGRPASALSFLAGSVVFAVGPDGSLRPLGAGFAGAEIAGQLRPILGTSGYDLVAGASTNFSYSGTINTLDMKSGISTRATYYVVIIGSHVLSIQTVKVA